LLEENAQTSDYAINHEIGLSETCLLITLHFTMRQEKYSTEDTERTLATISISKGCDHGHLQMPNQRRCNGDIYQCRYYKPENNDNLG